MKNVKKSCICFVAAVLLLFGCRNSGPHVPSAKAKTDSSAVADSEAAESTSKIETEMEKPVKITGFEDVNTDAVTLIALGNSGVPVGQYSEEIFRNLGFWDNIQGKVSYGTNVKEVLSQVEEGTVDCGVVYATDAATAEGIKVVCTAPEDALNTPVLYPAAVLKNSENPTAAKAFLNFLLSDGAVHEFEKVGFEMATDEKPAEVASDEACTLNVFAAASLMESLTSIQKLFNEQYPDITLVYNFDSSGTLQTQIEQGASADIFFSAAQKQMDTLQEEGYINGDTVINLLNNKVVLIVSGEKE